MAAQREVGVDALLDDDGSQLLEARDLRLRERLVDEVRERRSAPERERLAQYNLGRGCLAGPERSAPFLRQAREAVHVHVLWIELEDVAWRAGGDDGAERLTELRDIDLDCMRGRLGWIARPERLDEPVDGDDTCRLEREDGEESARLLPAKRWGDAVPLDLDRTEQTQLDMWGACPARSVHLSPQCFRGKSHFLTACGGFPSLLSRP